MTDQNDINSLKRKINDMEQEIANFPTITQMFLDEQTELQDANHILRRRLENANREKIAAVNDVSRMTKTACCNLSILSLMTCGIEVSACEEECAFCQECVDKHLTDALDDNDKLMVPFKCGPNCLCDMENDSIYCKMAGTRLSTLKQRRKELNYRNSLVTRRTCNTVVQRPCCHNPMAQGFEDCMAIFCDRCPSGRNYFCGLCFEFVGGYNETHAHVTNCKHNVQRPRSFYANTKKQKDICELQWIRYHIRKTIGDSAYAESGLDSADITLLKSNMSLVGLPVCRYGPYDITN
tara:strand:+ start:2629 stop:3510 length:882 start_codon:yes stop_codon:yes gene_type:complete